MKRGNALVAANLSTVGFLSAFLLTLVLVLGGCGETEPDDDGVTRMEVGWVTGSVHRSGGGDSLRIFLSGWTNHPEVISDSIYIDPKIGNAHDLSFCFSESMQDREIEVNGTALGPMRDKNSACEYLGGGLGKGEAVGVRVQIGVIKEWCAEVFGEEC